MKKDSIQDIFRNTFLAICSVGYLSSASPLLAEGSSSSRPDNGVAEKHEIYNLSVILNAQSHYQVLMSKTSNEYSAELGSLTDRLNNYSRRNNLLMYSRIIILDPLKADVGLALGLPKSMVINTLLLQNHVRPYASLSDLVGTFLIASVKTSTGEDSYSQNPHSLFLVQDNTQKSPCIIIPAPSNTIPDALKIQGLTLREQRDFENAHEGWHCLDNRYHVRVFAPKVYASFDPKNLKTLIGNKKGLEAYANAHMDEAFADTAALGEWIRRGQSLSIITQVKRWREEKAEDLVHMTAPVLAALEDGIMKMGLKKFRALTETEARDFYYTTVETYGLNAARLEAKIREDYSIPTNADTISDQDAQKALVFKISVVAKDTNDITRMLTSILGGSGLTPGQITRMKTVSDQVESWDATEALITKAKNEKHIITLLSLAKAYGDLEEQLTSSQNSNNSKADIFEAEAALLKEHFVADTIRIDFYSRKHGSSQQIAGLSR